MFKKDSTAHRVKDFIVSDRFFNIYEDAESKILWTDVDKSHNHLKYYLSDNYIPHSDKKGLLGFLYNFSQRLMFVYKRIVLSNQLKESRSVLDYGAGDGKFANYLEKKGSVSRWCLCSWKNRLLSASVNINGMFFFSIKFCNHIMLFQLR